MSYDHGRFVWFELVAGDHAAAKAFYPELLGWKLDPMKMPDGSSYPLLKAGGAPFGGMRDLPREGVPPHWVSYVSVADVDKTAKKVVAEGGKTLMDAISVPTVGRMQPVADPEGSVFMLFQAESGDPEPTQGAGAFHWNELWAKDPKAVAKFYEKVFGYQHDVTEMPSGEYIVLKNGDAMRGGILKKPSADIPSMWLTYFQADDCDATVKRATARGATQLGETLDVDGVGRFAILKDPLGAVIGVIKPAQG
jgi:hypothetical protein